MKRKPSKPTPIERFLALPDAEKARIADEAEEEFVHAKSKPLTARDKRILQKAGLPVASGRRDSGKRPISVTVQATLLREAEAFARKRGITRSELFEQGLRLAMSRPRAGAA
jgi:hypothetical protein